MVYRRKTVQLSIESFGSGLSTPLSPDNEWVVGPTGRPNSMAATRRGVPIVFPV